MKRVSILTSIFIAAALFALNMPAFGGIQSTKHNLSAGGPGTYRATTERQICIFCHTPHNAMSQRPLWNHDLSVQSYTAYWTPTLDAYASAGAAPPPDYASKQCLSCHDGTVALGAVYSRAADIPLVGGVTTLPSSSSAYVGTDLSGSHPISFIVTAGLIATNNAKDAPLKPLASMQTDVDGVRVDGNNKVQCTSCHDPHDDSNRASSGVPFWRKSTYAGVCTVCHDL